MAVAGGASGIVETAVKTYPSHQGLRGLFSQACSPGDEDQGMKPALR